MQAMAVTIYFALAFAISWGGLLATGGMDGLSADRWQSDPKLALIVAAMLAGPGVAGTVMTALVSGRAGIRELLSRLLRWRVGARWYVIALLPAPCVFVVVHLALSFTSPVFLPGIVTVSDPTSLLLASIVGALVVGFFEELGWTGFATWRLRSRHSVLATALMVGMPWGAWHLLTNDVWIAETYSGELAVPIFVILTGVTLVLGQLPAYRVLMVWVYEHTGSLLVAMLMHASLSASTFILGPAKVTGVALVVYGFSLAAAWWLVVGFVTVVNRRCGSKKDSARPVSPVQPGASSGRLTVAKYVSPFDADRASNSSRNPSSAGYDAPCSKTQQGSRCMRSVCPCRSC
jgi:uncharacterized protein